MAQVKVGVVVSDKMPKTIVVKVDTPTKHKLYKKTIVKSKKIKAHDELGAKIGQTVKIIETKPVSKNVHFKTLEVK